MVNFGKVTTFLKFQHTLPISNNMPDKVKISLPGLSQLKVVITKSEKISELAQQIRSALRSSVAQFTKSKNKASSNEQVKWTPKASVSTDQPFLKNLHRATLQPSRLNQKQAETKLGSDHDYDLLTNYTSNSKLGSTSDENEYLVPQDLARSKAELASDENEYLVPQDLARSKAESASDENEYLVPQDLARSKAESASDENAYLVPQDLVRSKLGAKTTSQAPEAVATDSIYEEIPADSLTSSSAHTEPVRQPSAELRGQKANQAEQTKDQEASLKDKPSPDQDSPPALPPLRPASNFRATLAGLRMKIEQPEEATSKRSSKVKVYEDIELPQSTRPAKRPLTQRISSRLADKIGLKRK